MEYTDKLKYFVLEQGADLVGITDTASLEGLKTIPEDLFSQFSHGVSIAVQVPTAVFEMISDQPTPLYSSVYQTINRFLDEIAFKTSRMLQKDGFFSLPIPASQTLDRKNWHAAVSHKAVARAAGNGWQGKNLLLITPEYGSRVRLVTVLVDAPLVSDKPVRNRCGECMACRDACPAGAIKGLNTRDHYESRNQAMYFDKCVEKLTVEFQQLPDVGVPICGICIKACPYGKRVS